MKVLVIQHNSSTQEFSHFGAHSRPHGIETRNLDFKEELTCGTNDRGRGPSRQDTQGQGLPGSS